jgi:arsenite methyltransferase
MNQDHIYKQVQDHYGSLAHGKNAEYGKTVAKSFGYTEEELTATPKEANLGLSCGNPLAIASLREVFHSLDSSFLSLFICKWTD